MLQLRMQPWRFTASAYVLQSIKNEETKIRKIMFFSTGEPPGQVRARKKNEKIEKWPARQPAAGTGPGSRVAGTRPG